jgi:hypothetical protein
MFNLTEVNYNHHQTPPFIIQVITIKVDLIKVWNVWIGFS